MKGYVTKNARHHSVKLYAVTGTKHGSLVYAKTEGDARHVFHKKYDGESIIKVRHIQYHDGFDEDMSN